MIMKNANRLLKFFNEKIPQLSVMRVHKNKEYTEIVKLLKDLRSSINTEKLWREVKVEYNMIEEKKEIKIIEVRKENKTIALLADDILKSNKKILFFEEPLKSEKYELDVQFTYTDIIEMGRENLKIFLSLVEISQYILIYGLIHSYRSYEPYISVLLIGTENKLFAFDLENQPELFLKNITILNKKMIFTDQQTAKFFPNLINYSIIKIEQPVYIDYRIRPLSLFKSYLLDAFKKINYAKLKNEKEISAFAFLNLPENKRDIFEKIIHLRIFVAKQFDESPEFVLTNRQIKELILTGDLFMKSYAFVAFKDDFYRIIKRTNKKIKSSDLSDQ